MAWLPCIVQCVLMSCNHGWMLLHMYMCTLLSFKTLHACRCRSSTSKDWWVKGGEKEREPSVILISLPSSLWQVQAATVAQEEDTMAALVWQVLVFPVSHGTLATHTNTSCTWRDLRSWREGTTIVVTLATGGIDRGVLRLIVGCGGSTAMCQDVVSRQVERQLWY